MLSIQELEANSVEVARVLKILAHPKRLLILCRLADGPLLVGELETACAMSQSQMSQFLSKMKKEGMLRAQKEWLFVRYEIADDRVFPLMQSLKNIYCR